MAEFKFLGFLAEIAGARSKEVVLEKPTRLREILPARFPEERVIVLIDQHVGHFDSLIEDKDSVILMPLISGG